MTEAALPTPAGKLPLRRTVDGWTILEIRGARDIPGYDPAEVGRGMSVQTYRREVLGDWTASAGKVVYEEYGDLHEPQTPLPFDPTKDLVCGWDLPAATGGTPAFVASQVSGAGQWCLYGALLPNPDESPGVWEFAERVAEWLTEKFCGPSGLRLQDLRLVHYGDPAGAQKGLSGTARELRSAYEIIRGGDKIEIGLNEITREPVYQERPGRGWTIQPGEVSATKRRECVKQRLMLNIRGAPALVVAPSATFIREGFRGGYHYAQRNDGRYELDPAKNRYSHVFDAIEYVASRLFLQHPQTDAVADYLRRQKQQAPATRGMGRGRGR